MGLMQGDPRSLDYGSTGYWIVGMQGGGPFIVARVL